MNTLHSPRALACLLLLATTGMAAHAQLKPPTQPATGLDAPRSLPAPQRTAPAGAAAAGTAAAPAPAAAPSRETLEKENAGRTAAAGWLTLLDRRDWGTAWETSAGMFRASVPLATWMDGIPKVREPLGTLVERKPADTLYRTRLEGRPEGDYVSVKFVTRFDQREVQEVVTTVREPDGRWRVTGYSAQ